jgi:hypothetical protein
VLLNDLPDLIKAQIEITVGGNVPKAVDGPPTERRVPSLQR